MKGIRLNYVGKLTLVLAWLFLLLPLSGVLAATEEENLLAPSRGGILLSYTSQYNDSDWSAKNLIDGGLQQWSSTDASFPQEFVFAFKDEETKLINKVSLNAATTDTSKNRWAKDFEVLVSTDSSNSGFRSVGTFQLENIAGDQVFEFYPVRAKYIMLRITSNYGATDYVELGEFKVFEAVRYIPPKSENLVASDKGGVLLSYTSQYNDSSWAAKNLIDGGLQQWSSTDASLPQEFVFAFQDEEIKLIDRVSLDAATVESKDRWAKDFEVLVSIISPTSGFKSVGTFQLENIAGDQVFEFYPTRATYVMLRITSNYGSTSYVQLGEFKVFEARSIWVSKDENLVASHKGGTVLSYTSQYNDSNWAAKNLIDGGIYQWSSANASFPQEFVFAFKDEETKLINKVSLNAATTDTSKNRWAKDFEVLVSTDSSNSGFRSVGTFQLENIAGDQVFEFYPVRAKYIMLRITSNYGATDYVELGEFKVFEAVRYIPPKSENLVASDKGGVLLSYTSQYNDSSWAAKNLIDGGLQQWSSTDASLPQEFVFAFQDEEIKLIDRVSLDAATVESKDRWAKDFEVLVSIISPTSGFKSVGTFQLENIAGDQVFEFYPTRATYVMLRITSNYGSTSYVQLGEFKVFEASFF